VPIHFSTDTPLLQVQPLHRSTYAEEVSNHFEVVKSMAEFPDQAWSGYEEHMVKPMLEPTTTGSYGAQVRKRRRSGCPVHSE